MPRWGLPIIRRLLPPSRRGFTDSLAATAYVGACVALLQIREQLSRYYWTNIGDRDLPFAGLIEHTNYVDRERYGGARLLYISNYLPPEHEFFQLDDDALIERFVDPIARVFPRFRREHIEQAWVSRDPVAQPVIEAGYQRRKPPYASPIPGVLHLQYVADLPRGPRHKLQRPHCQGVRREAGSRRACVGRAAKRGVLDTAPDLDSALARRLRAPRGMRRLGRSRPRRPTDPRV